MYSLELKELSLQETKEINGGAFPAYIAAKWAVAIVAGSYAVGEKVGEFIYNVTH